MASAPAPDEPVPKEQEEPNPRAFYQQDVPSVDDAKVYLTEYKENLRLINNKLREKPLENEEPIDDRNLFRWDTRGDLEQKGLTGSGFWLKTDSDGDLFANPLVNGSFGDKTIYTASTPNGALGFLNEMKRKFYREEERPEPKTYHLYAIMRPRKDTDIIELSKMHPEEFRGGYASDADLLERYEPIEKRFDKMLEFIPQLTKKQQKQLRTYLLNDEYAGYKDFVVRDGKKIPIGTKQPKPSMSDMSLGLGLINSSKDQIRQQMKLKTFREVGGWANNRNGYLLNRLAILTRNARKTNEAQIKGDIKGDDILRLGEFTLTPEMWDRYNGIKNSEPLKEEPELLELIEKARDYEDDAFV